MVVVGAGLGNHRACNWWCEAKKNVIREGSEHRCRTMGNLSNRFSYLKVARPIKGIREVRCNIIEQL